MQNLNKCLKNLIILLSVMLTSFAYGNRNFGLGVILGDPTGISIKYHTSARYAVTGTLAWHIDDHLHVNVNHVWKFPGLIPVDSGEFLGEVGLGAVLVTHKPHSHSIGLRFPFAGVYEFAHAPFDIFLELALGMLLIPGTDAFLHGGLGVRYYF